MHFKLQDFGITQTYRQLQHKLKLLQTEHWRGTSTWWLQKPLYIDVAESDDSWGTATVSFFFIAPSWRLKSLLCCSLRWGWGVDCLRLQRPLFIVSLLVIWLETMDTFPAWQRSVATGFVIHVVAINLLCTYVCQQPLWGFVGHLMAIKLLWCRMTSQCKQHVSRCLYISINGVVTLGYHLLLRYQFVKVNINWLITNYSSPPSVNS